MGTIMRLTLSDLLSIWIRCRILILGLVSELTDNDGVGFQSSDVGKAVTGTLLGRDSRNNEPALAHTRLRYTRLE